MVDGRSQAKRCAKPANRCNPGIERVGFDFNNLYQRKSMDAADRGFRSFTAVKRAASSSLELGKS